MGLASALRACLGEPTNASTSLPAALARSITSIGEPMPQASMFTSERMMASSCRCATSSDRTKRERMPACVAAGTAYFF